MMSVKWRLKRVLEAVGVITLLTVGLWERSFGDVVHLMGGQRLEGSILGMDEREMQWKATVGEGSAVMKLKKSQVQRIEQRLTSEEEAWMEGKGGGGRELMTGLWNKVLPTIGWPGSKADRVLLSWGRWIMEHGLKKERSEFLGRMALLSRQMPDSPLAGQLEEVELEICRKLGKTKEVGKILSRRLDVDERRRFEWESEKKFQNAEKDEKKLRKLIAEYPGWKQMPEKKEQGEALSWSVMNEYLYPAVFLPENSEQVSRGLYHVACVEKLIGEEEQARIYFEELVREFPETAWAGKARERVEEKKKKGSG